MIKTIIKRSHINTTHMVLSLCNYFPLRIHCNETLVYLCILIQKLATEKILEKGLQISEHMLLCMMWSTLYVLPGTFQWWGTLYCLKHYSWEVIKMFAVYIFWNVYCNRVVWWTQFVIFKMPPQHTKFPLMYCMVHPLRCQILSIQWLLCIFFFCGASVLMRCNNRATAAKNFTYKRH